MTLIDADSLVYGSECKIGRTWSYAGWRIGSKWGVPVGEEIVVFKLDNVHMHNSRNNLATQLW